MLLCVCLLLSLLCVTANAINVDEYAMDEIPVLPREVYIKGQMWLSASNRAETMDVSMYNLGEDEAEMMLDEIVEKSSYLLDTKLRYKLVVDGSYVKSIIFTYRDSGSYSAMSSEVAAEIDRILSVVDDSMSDLEKALAVNDYFCTNYSYDLSKPYNFTMEELLESKTGVCQAYALAYYYILNDCLDIDCALVTSDPMVHMWNAIKIDGEWYHVDVTWNDPVSDMPGRARHKYFVKSSSDFLSGGSDERHYGWKFKGKNYNSDQNLDIECSSDKYDDYFWNDIDTQILFDDEHYYYIGYSDEENSSGNCCVLKKDKSSGKTNELFEINDYWFVWGSSNTVYANKFSTLAKFDDLIAVNTTDTVFVIDTDGKVCQKYDLANDKSDANIYFLQISGNNIKCTMSRDLVQFGIEDEISFKLTPGDAQVRDINGDSEVSSDDTNLLSEYFTGWSRYFNIMSADLNKDGKLNRLDLLLFAQSIAD